MEVRKMWKEMDHAEKTCLCMELFGRLGWETAFRTLQEMQNMREAWKIFDEPMNTASVPSVLENTQNQGQAKEVNPIASGPRIGEMTRDSIPLSECKAFVDGISVPPMKIDRGVMLSNGGAPIDNALPRKWDIVLEVKKGEREANTSLSCPVCKKGHAYVYISPRPLKDDWFGIEYTCGHGVKLVYTDAKGSGPS